MWCVLTSVCKYFFLCREDTLVTTYYMQRIGIHCIHIGPILLLPEHTHTRCDLNNAINDTLIQSKSKISNFFFRV